MISLRGDGWKEKSSSEVDISRGVAGRGREMRPLSERPRPPATHVLAEWTLFSKVQYMPLLYLGDPVSHLQPASSFPFPFHFLFFCDVETSGQLLP